MKLSEIYEKRKTLQESSCFVCYKSSSTVLRNDKDWFYCCESHLKDLKFCKPVVKSGTGSGSSGTGTGSGSSGTGTDGSSGNTGSSKTKVESESSKRTDKPESTTDSITNTTATNNPTQFILHSAFLQMRENLKKPKQVQKPINFPAVPNTKLM